MVNMTPESITEILDEGKNTQAYPGRASILTQEDAYDAETFPCVEPLRVQVLVPKGQLLKTLDLAKMI
jgi:hypothetical protein